MRFCNLHFILRLIAKDKSITRDWLLILDWEKEQRLSPGFSGSRGEDSDKKKSLLVKELAGISYVLLIDAFYLVKPSFFSLQFVKRAKIIRKIPVAIINAAVPIYYLFFNARFKNR